MMLRIMALVCFVAIFVGCGGETATDKPETEKTDTGGGVLAPGPGGGVVAPGVSQSTINPQGARERAQEDLNKATSDLQKNLNRAKNTQGD